MLIKRHRTEECSRISKETKRTRDMSFPWITRDNSHLHEWYWRQQRKEGKLTSITCGDIYIVRMGKNERFAILLCVEPSNNDYHEHVAHRKKVSVKDVTDAGNLFIQHRSQQAHLPIYDDWTPDQWVADDADMEEKVNQRHTPFLHGLPLAQICDVVTVATVEGASWGWVWGRVYAIVS